MTHNKQEPPLIYPANISPTRFRNRYLILALTFVILILALSLSQATTAEAQVNFGVIREIAKVEIEHSNITNPVALGYSAADESLIVLDAASMAKDTTDIFAITTFGDLVSESSLSFMATDPVNLAYDGRSGHLISFDDENHLLTKLPADLTHRSRITVAPAALNLPSVADPQGVTLDPHSGDIYILDSAAREIMRVSASASGQISRIVLDIEDKNSLRTMAYNPENDHLLVFSPKPALLFEFDLAGRLIDTYEMAEFGISMPQAMVFAPSTNQNDAPEVMNLFLSGGAANSGIIEYSFLPLEPLSAAVTQPPLIQTIEVWQFDPPSPDASGLTYLSNSGTLLETDSEVNEKAIYQGANQFEMTLSGTLLNTYDTTHFSKEPTGVAFNPNNNHLYFSDDNRDMVWETDLSYSLLNSFPVDIIAGYTVDPEGMAYDAWNNRLFIAGGGSNTIFWVDPGPDAVYGTPDDEQGAFPATDLSDPEGITFNTDNGHIYAVGTSGNIVAEYTTAGDVINLFDISAANAIKPAGLAYGPASNSNGKSIYVSDRGDDSDANKNQGRGDGIIYEFALGSFDPSFPPTAAFAASPTSGQAPLTVDFTDLSTNMPNSWSWDFGDGSESTFQHPSHIYTAAGTYEVSLTVSNSLGSDSVTETVSITVTQAPPVASFTFTCLLFDCDFDASASIDPDGTIVNYAWDFGDGSTSISVTTGHSYAAVGTHTVTLTITDNDGFMDTVIQDVTVTDTIPLTVHVGDLDGSTASAPRNRWNATATITVHDNSGTITSPVPVSEAVVEGSWTDGASGNDSCTTDADGQCPITINSLKGNIAGVTFTVSDVTSNAGDYVYDENHDPDGDSNGTNIVIYKDGPPPNQPPVASFSSSCDHLTLECNFDAAGSSDPDGSIVAYDWDFGDGNAETGATASHFYAMAGSYSVTLTITDDFGVTGSDTQNVPVGVTAAIMHVGDLDGSAEFAPRNRWNATVTISVHAEHPIGATDPPIVANATVTGLWSNGANGEGSCLTDATGSCSISKANIKSNQSGVDFTIVSVTYASNTYDSGANHDPDNDSTGTVITILMPKSDLTTG